MKEKIRRLIHLPERVFLEPQHYNPTEEYHYRLRKPFKRSHKIMFGPPFTNGVPHKGTVFAVLVKSILGSCQYNLRKRIFLQPGFDCHGLPTEQYLIKRGVDASDKSEFWSKCHLISRKNLLIQVLFYRNYLGVLASWDRVYATHNDQYVRFVQKQLNRLKDLTVWDTIDIDFCPKLKTVVPLSESENRTVKRPETHLFMETDSDYLLYVWTTTPWSLPANNGVAINKDFQYHVYDLNGKRVIAARCPDGENWVKLNTFPTDQLISLRVKNLFNNRLNRVVYADWVRDDKPAGIVHIAGLYDIRDYGTSVEHGMELINLSEHNVGLEDWVLKSVEQNNAKVLDYLNELGLIWRVDWNNKSVRFFERSDAQTIKMVKNQFFLKTSAPRVKARSLMNVRRIKWFDKGFQNYVMKLILGYKGNWILSRNRVYNTPLSTEPMHTVGLRKQWALEDKEGLDVWFDSANSFLYCYDSSVDLSIEGIDQYKGYFLRSLQLHSALNIHLPAKRVLHTGFVVDQKGHKLSKSKGNYRSVYSMIKEFDKDVVNIWVARNKLHLNSKIDNHILNECLKDYKSIRNYLNFVLGYWGRFVSGTQSIPWQELGSHHKWLLQETKRCVLESYRSYVKLDIHESFHLVKNLLTLFSKYYIHSIKSTLYFRSWDDTEVRQIMLVFRVFLNNILVLLRPFVPNLIRSINAKFYKLPYIWDLRLINYPCFKKEHRLYEQGLNFFKSMRGRYENFISQCQDTLRPYQVTLHLNESNKSIVKPITFFSYWGLCLVRDLSVPFFSPRKDQPCDLCMRQLRDEDLETCRHCDDFAKKDL